jgi:hypothetical protein
MEASMAHHKQEQDLSPESGSQLRNRPNMLGVRLILKGVHLAKTCSFQKASVWKLIVQFDSEHTTAEKIVLKYEWRSELCKKGIIPCGPKNRFWPDDQEFTPIPTDFKG